jgi:4'-phosphopantetheinyl transferase
VHVWTFTVPATMAEAAPLFALLSDTERHRIGRYVYERERARAITCRGMLRALLSRYLRMTPQRIEFQTEPNGKPFVTSAEGWHFNLSHSGELAAVALSREAEVGIDVERMDPEFPRADVGPEFLALEELAALKALPENAQTASFYQYWTLKEALLKAGGIGLLQDPREIRLQMNDGKPEVVSAPEELRAASLQVLGVSDNYAAALAVLGPPPEVVFFTI